MCAENPKTNPLKSQNTSEPLSDHSRCVKKPCQSGISLSNDDAMVMDLSYSALHDKKPNSTYPNMVVTPLVLPNTNDVASNKVGQNSCMQTKIEAIETMEGIEKPTIAPHGINQRPLSYKATLLSPNIDQVHDDDDTQEDDDIDLLEGDVICSTVNGRKIGYTALQTKILDLWKSTEQVRIMDIENDYFLITFRSRKGYLKIAEYEALPTICFECGKYGHVKDIFPSHAPEQPPTSTVNPETTPNLNDPINSNFGPWMKVERRQRHIAPKQFQPVDKPIVQGSRFIPIFETLDEDVTTSEVGPYGTPTAPVCTKKTLPH
ncbi:hypothetical protein V6N12_013037 [Hibiscus sabdariffa]|uniref:DUF4283 domain-containing protein n=1 Tax=Hibiscus sabdariffa TaxID=183260 RepID=A0ABR2EGI9_9ROSI